MNKTGIGAYGEYLAEKYLKKQGYKIVAKNCKFAGCELDIVCILPKKVQKKQIKNKYKTGVIKTKKLANYLIDSLEDVMVFIEVKYSSTRIYGEPMERVDITKQRQITKAAQGFINKNQIKMPCRFDCVSIVGTEITHVENAFEANI